MSQDVHAHLEKSNAALSSVLWSLFLTGIKIWAGVSTGSLGILSEALHSGLDFIAAAMTFYAVRIAAAPADETHPYGHDKVESLSALAESLLLVVTCVWIFWEAIDRLFFSHKEIDLNLWAFGVVLVSLIVDVNRSAMLRRVAKKHKSQALEADALHFTTDIWSSAVVLLGLICVWLARFAEPGTWLHASLQKADSVAAMGVALIVLHVSYGLCRRAIHTLMDGGSKELTDSVLRALEKEYPAYPVKKIRLREVGARAYAELDIAVPSDLPVETAHDITHEIEAAVQRVLPDCDVTVHTEPQAIPENAPADLVVHHLAVFHGLRVHGYAEAQSPGGLMIFLDVELPPEWTLARAEGILRAFENDVKHHLGAKRIISRLEPNKRLLLEQNLPNRQSDHDMKQTVSLICKKRPGFSLLKVDIRRVDGVPLVIVKGSASPDMTVLESHTKASELEKDLKHALPGAGRVMVILTAAQ